MAPPPEVEEEEEEVENDEVIDESFGIQSMESKSLQFDRRNRSPPRPIPRPSSSPSSPSSCFSSCSPDVDEVSSFHALNERNSEKNERNIGKASASRYGTQKETVLMEREQQHGQDTTRWTNDKHRAYLNRTEATFVRQMYDSEYCSLELCGKKPAKG